MSADKKPVHPIATILAAVVVLWAFISISSCGSEADRLCKDLNKAVWEASAKYRAATTVAERDYYRIKVGKAVLEARNNNCPD